MTPHTPLRYPGGKARLGAWLAMTMRFNQISGGTYCEAYAGGAGAAAYLLLNQYVEEIIINDLDPVIHAFWWAVLNDADTLKELIRSTEVNMETWEAQKYVVDNHKSCKDKTALGFACFFLNRTNRSGIIKGGVIGGKDQSGEYQLDARYNKLDLIDRISRINYKKDRIKLYNLDAADFIRDVGAQLPTKSLLYLDPPYFQKGNQLYSNYYRPEDHKKIEKCVRDFRTPILITYDNCEAIKEIYAGYESCEFSLIYSSSATRPTATEILIRRNIDLPTEPILTRTTRAYPKKWDSEFASARATA